MRSTFPPAETLRARDVPGLVRCLSRTNRASLRAAWRVQRAMRSVHRQLLSKNVDGLRVPPTPVDRPFMARSVTAVVASLAARIVVEPAIEISRHPART